MTCRSRLCLLSPGRGRSGMIVNAALCWLPSSATLQLQRRVMQARLSSPLDSSYVADCINVECTNFGTLALIE